MHTVIAIIGFLVLVLLASVLDALGAGLICSVPALIVAILVGADPFEWVRVVFVGAAVVWFPIGVYIRVGKLVDFVKLKRQEDRLRKRMAEL